MGLDYATEDNEGRIFVDLSGGRVDVPPPLPEQPHQGGYGAGAGAGHQQQQQDIVDDLVTTLLKKLGNCCCTVM